MRRGLKTAAIVAVVVGLEASTRAPTLALRRIAAGWDAMLAGVEFHVGAVQFVVGLVLMVVGLAVWGALKWSDRAAKAVTWVGPNCPQCGNRTRRVKRKEWQRILSQVMGERITRRRCERCGWTGLSLGT